LCQNHANKFLVVDVTLSVLLSMYEGLDLFLCHLLPKAHKEVAQLSGRNTPVTLLVKMAETFDKIVHCVSALLARDCLKHGEKLFKSYSGISFVLSRRLNKTLNLRLGWILAESTQYLSDLLHRNLSIPFGVEE
jgi:hypothetical protein